MRLVRLSRIFLIVTGIVLSIGTCSAKDIEVLFTNNPPLICATNGELDCIAGNLLKSAAKAGGFSLKIREVPWSRAQELLETVPNSIFASTGRNEFSEASFNWYFQIYTDDVFVWTLRGKKVSSDSDIAKLGKINVRRGSPFGAYLEKRGAASKIFETNDWLQGAEMLDTGRVDAMCLTGIIGRKNIIELQKVPESDVNKYKVGEISWYLNVKAQGTVSAELVEFKRLLDAEKAKPAFQEVLKKFGVRN